MRFSKQPYKIATPGKTKRPKMKETVGQVLGDTGLAYRRLEKRGHYSIDHLPSGRYVAHVEATEAKVKRICKELATVIDFKKPREALNTTPIKDQAKLIVDSVLKEK